MWKFGLFGHPVAHSLSPFIHEASFLSLGLDASYRCFDVPPSELREAFFARRAEGFLGVNVTVPDKVHAFSLMDSLDNSARLFGAVNTVRFEPDGTLAGFNTDATGFLEDLRVVSGISPAGRCILIAGCGGAGRAIAIGCASAGAAEIFLANRTVEKAQAIADEITKKCPACGRALAVPYTQEDWCNAARQADVLVQCTTAGMKDGDASAFPSGAFRPGQVLYDVVYTRPVTPTMEIARSAGCRAFNGAGMLARQGAASFKIWTGVDADIEAMLSALKGRKLS